MAPTVEIEATSATTARAKLAGADVPPMELLATEDKALSAVVHEFVRTIAVEQQSAVEVVYRTGKDTRFLTVGTDGKLTESAPSVPIPVVAVEPQPAAAEPVSAPPAGPVTVAAEPITYAMPTAPATALAGDTEAPTRPTPTAAPARPADTATGPIRGPQSVLSAPGVNPAANRPARNGMRGRLNAMLGLTLAPKADSLEMRLRDAQATIACPLPDGAVITFVNLKGGVGKTPMSIALAETIAEHRGPATAACLDLGEIGGSFADRVAVPPAAGQDAAALLADLGQTPQQVRPSTLTRYLTRQPSGSYVVAGKADAATPLSFQDAATLGAILERHYDLLLADTGNASHSGSWQWAITAAHTVVVPVPLRRDAAVAAQRTLTAISAVRPDVLARTVVVVTDGPGDAPMVETEAVEAFTALGVSVCRMPFEPVFASGERIAYSQLRRETRDALTVLAATVTRIGSGAAG
ncbi:MinD-like ATPase involved in chromosome partitioning or flagellar assembly [Rhodococcus sp. SMB37]|uniref:ParA family protein n=1 Tax=Rhodococcus sp. SMB37 TaxID=2512213 RepID=UPI001045E6D6|nr:ParA family protein [Rhodococcus sp. SMB37]TCN53490.1 MinD-like ATPase involved in chromosome partitioning or flagellar assembly [Rhodococcus sp. SMB37]